MEVNLFYTMFKILNCSCSCIIAVLLDIVRNCEEMQPMQSQLRLHCTHEYTSQTLTLRLHGLFFKTLILSEQ